MKKFEYDNAIVYITIPTEKQLENIRKSTDSFVKALIKKGELKDEWFDKR
jgi:hypothetical protein